MDRKQHEIKMANETLNELQEIIANIYEENPQTIIGGKTLKQIYNRLNRIGALLEKL